MTRSDLKFFSKQIPSFRYNTIFLTIQLLQFTEYNNISTTPLVIEYQHLKAILKPTKKNLEKIQLLVRYFYINNPNLLFEAPLRDAYKKIRQA